MSGFFGRSRGGDDNSSSTTSNTSSSSPFSTTSGDSSSAKSRIQTQIQTETAVTNAKALISKVNENCFNNCVPSPGASLSSKEQNCLTSCMEKYIEAWNVTSRSYLARLGQDAGKFGIGAAGPSEPSGGLLS